MKLSGISPDTPLILDTEVAEIGVRSLASFIKDHDAPFLILSNLPVSTKTELKSDVLEGRINDLKDRNVQPYVFSELDQTAELRTRDVKQLARDEQFLDSIYRALQLRRQLVRAKPTQQRHLVQKIYRGLAEAVASRGEAGVDDLGNLGRFEWNGDELTQTFADGRSRTISGATSTLGILPLGRIPTRTSRAQTYGRA